MTRGEAPAPGLPEPQDEVVREQEPSRVGKWARAGLAGLGIASVAGGVMGYTVLHQPSPLSTCGSPDIQFEQQLDEATYNLDLEKDGDALKLCVDAPGKAGDYAVTYEDGSYRVQTRTFYQDFETPIEAGENSNYTVPHEGQNELVGADESRRWPLADEQEQSILEAWQQHTEDLGQLTVESGVITFPNSQAAPEPLMANRLTVDGEHFYTLNDSHGNGLVLFSETPWNEAESLDALARVADYSATVPDHLATGVTSVDFKTGGKPGADWAAATYYDPDQVVFWNGTSNLSERVLVHELGHEIGFDAGRATRGPVDRIMSWFRSGAGVPRGWEAAMDSDGEALSQYSHNSKREDFAESWLGYLDAREHDALGEFREAYPARTEILDSLYQATS